MKTEALDPRYRDLDLWPTALAVEAMLEGQMAAVAAIQSQTAAIARAAEDAAVRLGDTGRLVFVGAGTSGRLAVQDGTELHPTYGWPMERMVFLMAGGTDALTEAQEGAEDDAEAGRAEVRAAGIGPRDVVIGVAASGRTPYTLAAIEQARVLGALTVGVANNGGIGAAGGQRASALRGDRQRDRRRVHPHEGGHRAEGHAQPAVHRDHDPAGAGLRRAHGRDADL